MATLQIRIDDELKNRVVEAAQRQQVDVSLVVRNLLAAFVDGRLPSAMPDDAVLMTRLPTDAELLYVLSDVARGQVADQELNSARYLPLLFSRDMVDALQDSLTNYIWG
jgi:antitoxin component of RelBE/YafQ-DinJ toxin-antitoxin module